MFSLWTSNPSTPKRSSTLKPGPLTPKLTTVTSPEYPSPVPHDTQWEHVKHGSPSSPDADDEGTFESLGYSQVVDSRDRDRDRDRPPPPPPPSLPPQWVEERDRLRQQLDASLAAQRKAETERDRWERKAVELRASTRSERERDKDGSSSARSRRDKEKETSAAAVAVTDTLKEENEKLKSTMQQQTQQLDAAKEEMKRERLQLQVKAEKLKGELDAVHGAHKEETEALKTSLQEHAQQIERLSGDCDRIRKDRESIRGDLSTEIDQLKRTHARETEQFKTALEEVNRDRIQTHSDLRKARKSLDTYASKLDENLREIDTLRRELFDAKESNRKATELKQRLDVQSKELQTAREESSALKKEFNHLSTLLEDRTSELKGAQSFLTTADAFSGVEVTNTLQRLNAEVLQSTAYMAESMVELFFHQTPQVSKTDEQLAACKRASAEIGGAIVHFLGTKKHGDDPILIQIAFQAYLTYRLRWIACAWIVGGDENHNRFINAIYQSVHDKEAQAIAGRWRALTRAHVPSTSLDDAQLALQIASKMTSGLGDILLATGCTAPKPDITSTLMSKFSEKLAFLVSLAMRVNKIVGEEVTSGDFEVLAVPPATAFDMATMEDSYDDGRSAKAGGKVMSRVLCATDLGLRKKTRVGMTGDKQWETKVLLKPKVALESVVEIMDE